MAVYEVEIEDDEETVEDLLARLYETFEDDDAVLDMLDILSELLDEEDENAEEVDEEDDE